MLVAPAGRATAHFFKNIMASSGNCGVVAPLTYNSKRKKVGGGIRENGMAPWTNNSKRKKVGGGIRENGMSGCSDRGLLGSKMPENMTSLYRNIWRHAGLVTPEAPGLVTPPGARKNSLWASYPPWSPARKIPPGLVTPPGARKKPLVLHETITVSCKTPATAAVGYWASVSSMERHRALACLEQTTFYHVFRRWQKKRDFLVLWLVMLVGTTKCFKFALLRGRCGRD